MKVDHLQNSATSASGQELNHRSKHSGMSPTNNQSGLALHGQRLQSQLGPHAVCLCRVGWLRRPAGADVTELPFYTPAILRGFFGYDRFRLVAARFLPGAETLPPHCYYPTCYRGYREKRSTKKLEYKQTDRHHGTDDQHGTSSRARRFVRIWHRDGYGVCPGTESSMHSDITRVS